MMRFWFVAPGVLLVSVVFTASAQVLEGVEDTFGVPYGQTLQVERYGVLENDLLDGEPAGENGATAELLGGVSFGTLACPDDGTLELCADGSFEYTPGAGFNGIDSFSYQVISGVAGSAAVTVWLSACDGGPEIFSCWKEAAFLDKLAGAGYGVFSEGFEGSDWDGVRTAVSSPNTAPSVTSQGLTWTSNHPASNPITTSNGAARSGSWGAYDANHGLATGSPVQCDVDNPPESCLYYDGLSASIQPGGAALHGVGAYISGIHGSKVVAILDGSTEVGFGPRGSYQHKFHGVVDLGTNGFDAFEFREVDGKVGQALYVWFDDFKIAASDSPSNIAPVAHAGTDQAVLVGDTVSLDGSASFDANADGLAFNWQLTDKPVGSSAGLSAMDVVGPTFLADQEGFYAARLVVNDGSLDSQPDMVEIYATQAASNIPPVADAGVDQAVAAGTTVTLDGSGSSDGNGDPMNYSWIFTVVPAGSAASLSFADTVSPGFVADLPGVYVVELVVSDAVADSDPDTVEINVPDSAACLFYLIPGGGGRDAVVCL